MTKPGAKVEFEANNKGSCPCGLEIADPRNHGTIFERVAIHFDAPTQFVSRGTGFAACDPLLKVPGKAGVMFTGDPTCVTCPACKASESHKAALEKAGVSTIPTDADGLKEWKPPVKPTA